MTTYLLAGGGTAGHVNPLLAVADRLRARDPQVAILVLGTKEGLEARLVPERGYELLTIERLPFPRRPNRAALRFPSALRGAVDEVRAMIRDRGVDVVIGFGGYASAPAYLAARAEGTPLQISVNISTADLAKVGFVEGVEALCKQCGALPEDIRLEVTESGAMQVVAVTDPMVTVPWPDCSMTQLPSHRRSCGQMRPQISGNVLVAWLRSYASSKRPSAVRRSQSGMLLCRGQCDWQ